MDYREIKNKNKEEQLHRKDARAEILLKSERKQPRERRQKG